MTESRFMDCSTVKEKLEYKNTFGPPSEKKIAEMIESILAVGQLIPIIVNQHMVLIDGHLGL